MADTVPAMLEPGEYVIRKDAAEEIGIDNLDMLNNVDRSSQMYMNHGGLVPQLQHGHSAIDELLAMNTLSNQNNVDMTRQNSMMNQGGEVPQKPDPLQIDARMRGEFKNMGTIGAVDSNKYYSNLLNEAMQDREMLEKASFLEGYAPSEEKIEQDIFKALDYFSRKHKASPKVQGYSEGGNVSEGINSYDNNPLLNPFGGGQSSFGTESSLASQNFSSNDYQGSNISFGGETTGVKTLADIFQDANMNPNEMNMDLFSEYDMSGEESLDRALQRRGDQFRNQGQQTLRGIRQGIKGSASSSFGESGFQEAALDSARRQAEQNYGASMNEALEMNYEDKQALRDQYEEDTLSMLGQVDAAGGTNVIENAPASESLDIILQDGHWERGDFDPYKDNDDFMGWFSRNFEEGNQYVKRSMMKSSKKEVEDAYNWWKDNQPGGKSGSSVLSPNLNLFATT